MKREGDDTRAAHRSCLGLWDRIYAGGYPRLIYGDPTTAKIAGGFLNHPEILAIEDWGCGYDGFRDCIAPWQRYIGIDGSRSQHADLIVDLEVYTSEVDGIHLRHVVEHNPGWQSLLSNALASLRKRMVLTLFTPFAGETGVLASYPNFNETGGTMIDIAFSRDDLVRRFGSLNWFAIENIRTETQYRVEHMFFVER